MKKRYLLCAFMAGMVVLSAGADVGKWTVLPIFGGGYVQNVFICPSKRNVWYTYVDVGGPYRSDDHGRHWRPLHGNLTHEQRENGGDLVRSMSVDPRDENSFVFCSGESFKRPAGIFVTKDGGKTFRKTAVARFYGNGTNKRHGFAVDRNPCDSDELVAGEDWDGVLRSLDGGETWSCAGLKGHLFTDIRYDRAVKGRVWGCAPPPLPRDLGGRSYKSGLYRSDDGGKVWKKVSDTSPMEICQIKGRSEVIGYFRNDRVRVSHDGGVTWKDFSQGLPLPARVNPGNTEPGVFYAFGTGRDFYLAGEGNGNIYIRNVADDRWTKITIESKKAGNPVAEPRLAWSKNPAMLALSSIIVDPLDNRHWLATDYFEIWETRDRGRTWTSRVDGIMQLVSFTVECDPFNERNILFGVADLGSCFTTDGGKIWHQTAGWNYACSAAWSRVKPGLAMLVGGKSEMQIRRSFESAGKWWKTPALRGLPPLKPAQGGAGVFTIAANPVADEFVICVSGPVGRGRGGVYRTSNSGDDWEWFGEGLPEGVDLFKDHEWAAGGPNPQLHFACDGSAVVWSAKACKMWYLDKDRGRWMESKGVCGLCAGDPFVPGRFLHPGKTMMESLDGGRTFHPGPIKGLPPVKHIAFDCHNKGYMAFGLADRSVAVSRDGGRTFSLLAGSEKIPSGCSSRLVMDRKRVFFITSGSGVFSTVVD